MGKIQNGDVVTVHYTGKLEDGSVFDSSLVEGREPIIVKLGEGTLIKGFENGLIGMSVGDTKTVEIDPEDAYGTHNPMLKQEIGRDQVPQDVKVGDMLQGMSQTGPINVRIDEIKESTVVIDMNHPLAGKKLIFDLEVISVN